MNDKNMIELDARQSFIGKKANAISLAAKIVSAFIASLSGIILIGIIGFILWKAIDGFRNYGIDAILGTVEFNITSDVTEGVSFWSPFAATMITTLIALLIAVPIGIKTSVFIKFRVHKKYQKFLRICVETLAGIPSVIFGLFAAQSLKYVVNLFGISSYSILNASIMLSFMILPTIIAMTYNSLENVESALFNNSVALGCTKTKAIYKVYKKAARSGIIVGVILGAGRAIGETMALSMLLQSESDYTHILESGSLYDVLASNIKTISVIISTNMFTENSTEQTKSLLFAFGFLLFVIIMILNLIVLRITRTKNKKTKHKLNRFADDIFLNLRVITDKISSGFEYLVYPLKRTFKIKNYNDAVFYMECRSQHYKFKNMYSYYKIFWEIICVSLCFAFLAWLSLEIIVMGINSWSLSSSTVFEYTKNTTGQALLNTILIIMVSIMIGFPLSLLTAVYINEFSKNKYAKKIVSFFLDSLGATPSILFGMFGLLFFIETLQWTSEGAKGFSLIAGALTITLVILPTFTRSIQQSLNDVPQEMRLNGLALGSSTFQVVRKIIIPAALTGLVTSMVLSIGRILSETAPLYLTAGLTSSKQTSLINAGQTLTTRIYAQLSSTNIQSSLNIMYEASFLTLLLILILVLLGYYVIPNWNSIKKETINLIHYIKFYFQENMFIKRKNKMQTGVDNV